MTATRRTIPPAQESGSGQWIVSVDELETYAIAVDQTIRRRPSLTITGSLMKTLGL